MVGIYWVKMLPSFFEIITPSFSWTTLVGLLIILLGFFNNFLLQGFFKLLNVLFNNSFDYSVFRVLVILFGFSLFLIPGILMSLLSSLDGVLVLVIALLVFAIIVLLVRKK